MKVVKKNFKHAPNLNKEEFSNLIRAVISYNNIEIDEKMFFSSTAFYTIKNDKNFEIKEAFPLKLLIPDFITENFSLHTKEQKKIIINFLKIFINEIIFLSYYVEMNKKFYTYTALSFENCLNNSDAFFNKRNIILFFEKFFKEKITINENLPKKVKNNKQFILGKNCIYSNAVENNYSIGECFYSFLNKISVFININYYEIEKLKFFLKILGFKQHYLIFSSQNHGKIAYYKIKFIFEKNKCVSVFTIPNIEMQNIKSEII